MFELNSMNQSVHRGGWSTLLGMAIYAWLVGTRLSPTLMGQVLLDPIKNRVGFGFKKKTLEAGPGRV